MKIRFEGLALLTLCALAVYRLYLLVHGIPPHHPTPYELVLGLVGVITGFAGAAMLVNGPALFQPYEWPPRNRG